MKVRDPIIAKFFEENPYYLQRGFLPVKDPLTNLPSEMHQLDSIGYRLPQALTKPEFRHWAHSIEIPPLRLEHINDDEKMRVLRLYYVRVAFLASAYIHQVGQPKATALPSNIAKPLITAAAFLRRPPILSYDGYALYNWRRIDPRGYIELGNIETIQNFVSIKDEPWFILVHVEIEAIASRIMQAISDYAQGGSLYATLEVIRDTVQKMIKVLRRIPEHMSDELYFRTFRPYIASFENIVYEGGGSQEPRNYRGETGAQSSIKPLLDAFLKVPYKRTILTEHLHDMLNYMPPAHVDLISAVRNMSPIRNRAPKAPWNEVLEAMAEFRSVHLGFAQKYIERHGGKKGTGGTPYMEWLDQLRVETLAWRK